MINLPQGITRYSTMGISLLSSEDKDTDGSHSIQSIEGDGNLCWESKCCSSRINGPFTVSFPSSHLLSQSQDTEQTAQMTEHQSNRQSVVEPEHSRQAHIHNSVTNIQCPAWHQQPRQRNLSLCNHPFKLPGTMQHSDPQLQ